MLRLCVQKSMQEVVTLLAVATVALAGCHAGSDTAFHRTERLQHNRFVLQEISAERAADILSQLDFGMVSIVAESNAVGLTAPPEQLKKAEATIRLIDSTEPFMATSLAPISAVRTVPSNAEIARSIDGLTIGTFTAPPTTGTDCRGIIDVHENQVVAIIPASIHRELVALVRLGPDGFDQLKGDLEPGTEQPKLQKDTSAEGPTEPTALPESAAVVAEKGAKPATDVPPRPRVRVVRPAVGRDAQVEPQTESACDTSTTPQGTDESISRTTIQPAEPMGPKSPGSGGSTGRSATESSDQDRYEPASVANAEEVLRLDLPQQLEMAELLDLVGEYLHLDYLYEPEKIRGVVTLRLHGKLQGEMRVRDLYCLLESVLKFKGYVMTCHKGNLVTIVPAADALQVNPDLIDSEGGTIEAGDMVVTSIFELRHIAVSAASTLLQNMKLSLAVTPVEGSPALIVTCYAHQIDRIERLLNVVDRPGRPREFKFHQLRYTTADSLTKKVQALIGRLENVSIAAEAAPMGPARPPMAPGPAGRGGYSPTPAGSAKEAAYLEADERTNRILIIGYSEQIALVERLVDSLDVARQDLRVLKIYDVQHVEAEEIKKKLQELEIIGGGTGPRMAGVAEIPGAEIVEGAVAQEPVLVVLEATNSLVVNAAEEQHARIEAVLAYLDTEVRSESIPYEIYFLENQDPEGLAQVLEEIIHETVQDKDGKLQRILRDTAEQIVIVPDKNTFSLIVYATRKNQEWISKLIKTLDRRRPQVLIDVTLVEIRKMDEFNYDLNLITSFPDLTETGGQTGQFYTDQDTTVVEKLLQSGRTQFMDFEVASGVGTGFYADRHINALLTVVQTKNYGRVLAKPKVLVNDNEKGLIKTADTTYVVTRSSIPVTSGAAGPQNTLIETEVKYEPYDAGITLEITPHISEGRLLRLEITLNRSDFTSVAGEKPPDQTSSDIATIVTVPDGSTIILGGMLKLNQNKAVSKVPILGDLPLLGGIFRGIDNSDIQSKLYVFVRAEIIRPADAIGDGYEDLKRISEKNREAFERHEQEFQSHQTWPGIKPEPMPPPQVLDAR